MANPDFRTGQKVKTADHGAVADMLLEAFRGEIAASAKRVSTAQVVTHIDY